MIAADGALAHLESGTLYLQAYLTKRRFFSAKPAKLR